MDCAHTYSSDKLYATLFVWFFFCSLVLEIVLRTFTQIYISRQVRRSLFSTLSYNVCAHEQFIGESRCSYFCFWVFFLLCSSLFLSFIDRRCYCSRVVLKEDPHSFECWVFVWSDLNISVDPFHIVWWYYLIA